MKHACHKKMIILTTICARESQISVSTSTSNVPKHYCGKILSLYDRKTIFNTGEEPTPENKIFVGSPLGGRGIYGTQIENRHILIRGVSSRSISSVIAFNSRPCLCSRGLRLWLL